MFPELCREARQNPRVVRALEELTMRSQSDVEFERYEARRKFWLDINSAVRDTLFQGEKMGAIHLCERLLQRPETPTEQLAGLSPDDLTRLADELEAQVVRQR